MTRTIAMTENAPAASPALDPTTAYLCGVPSLSAPLRRVSRFDDLSDAGDDEPPIVVQNVIACELKSILAEIRRRAPRPLASNWGQLLTGETFPI